MRVQVSSRVIPQPSALEIEFSAHEQLSGRLDSLRGELAKEGVGQVPLDARHPSPVPAGGGTVSTARSEWIYSSGSVA